MATKDEILNLEKALDNNSRTLEEVLQILQEKQSLDARALEDELEHHRAKQEAFQCDAHATQQNLDLVQMQVGEQEQLIHKCLSKIRDVSDDMSQRLSSHNFRMAARLRALDTSNIDLVGAVEQLQESRLEQSFTIFL